MVGTSEWTLRNEKDCHRADTIGKHHCRTIDCHHATRTLFAPFALELWQEGHPWASIQKYNPIKDPRLSPISHVRLSRRAEHGNLDGSGDMWIWGSQVCHQLAKPHSSRRIKRTTAVDSYTAQSPPKKTIHAQGS